MSAKTREQLIVDIADEAIGRAMAAIDLFAVKLATDPAFALGNCDHIIEAGAILRVNSRVRDALTKPGTKATAASVKEFVMREALSHARNPERSTSVTSCLSHRYTGAAWADLLDRLSQVEYGA